MTELLHTGGTVPDAESPFSLVQLADHHPVDKFTCGSRPGAAEIDEYLKVNALVEQAAGLSAVWVALDRRKQSVDGQIVGYFTLSPLSIRLSESVLASMGLAEVQYRSVGGFLLGRLGVAVELQGQNFGAALVARAIKTAREAQREVGGVFVAVDPKNDGLVAWYEKLDFGFRRLDPTRRRLVLPLKE